MKKWDYKTVMLASDPALWQFEQLGNEGWELVQIVEAPVSQQKYAIFKKPEVPTLSATGRVPETNQWL